MAKLKNDLSQYFTTAEIEEIEMLRNSQEVKKAEKARREKYKARQYLYSLRALYKQGKDILETQNLKGDTK